MSTLSTFVHDHGARSVRLEERYLALRRRFLPLFGWGVLFGLGVVLALLDPHL